jgi:hypothetical protein
VSNSAFVDVIHQLTQISMHNRDERGFPLGIATFLILIAVYPAVVRNEVAEIRESIELSGEAKGTPYTAFFETPGNRKRLLIVLVVAMGTQLSGNGIVT